MNTTQSTFTILGGGIAGLTAFVALERIGIKAQLFEASSSFEPAGAGLIIAENALRALDRIDLAASVIDAGARIQTMKILNHKGSEIAVTQNSDLDLKFGSIAIHRGTLANTLLSSVSSERFHLGKRSTKVKEEGAEYVISFQDGTSHHTKNIIVAEGINSPIRQQLFPSIKKRYAGYTCWRGMTENKLGIYSASEYWGPKGRIGIIPIDQNKLYWFAVQNSPEAKSANAFRTPQQLALDFSMYPLEVAQVLNATPATTVLWNDIHDLEKSHSYHRENILFIGDSIHATTPNMGQGACQAIEDAVVLMDCLRNNSIVKEAFRSFEEKRLKRVHYIVDQSWKLGKMAQIENKFLGYLRNLIVKYAPKRVVLKQLSKVYTFDLGQL